MMQEGGGQDGGADPSHSGYAQQVDYFNICIVLLLTYCFFEALIHKKAEGKRKLEKAVPQEPRFNVESVLGDGQV